MRKPKLVLILILLFVFCSGAFAGFGMRPYVSGWFGASLCHGTAQYLQEYPGDASVRTPLLRTSTDFGFDVQLVEPMISVGKDDAFTFGVGFSYLNVSQSIAYGRSILKPYSGFGLSADMGWKSGSGFNVNLKYRYLYCTYTGSFSSFIAQDFEIAPGYYVASPWALDICVSLPLTVSYKADAISFRAGICVLVALDSVKVKQIRSSEEGGEL